MRFLALPRLNRRPGFTLLEMILAMAIGMLLLGGLYVALDMHMSATNSGRIQIEQAQVANIIVKKVTADIKSHLAMLDVYPGPLTTSTSTSSGGTSTSSTSTSTASTSATTTGMPTGFNWGVQGTNTQVSLYISKLPKAATIVPGVNDLPGQGADVQANESDQRRITYYLVQNGDGMGGLARQETVFTTSLDELNSLPPDLPFGVTDEQSLIFAKTVIAVGFEYFDGANWQTEWDGTVLMSDGVTLTGPPLAIAITVSIARPDNLRVTPDDPSVRTFRHVVQIPTASFHISQASSTGGTMP